MLDAGLLLGFSNRTDAIYDSFHHFCIHKCTSFKRWPFLTVVPFDIHLEHSVLLQLDIDGGARLH